MLDVIASVRAEAAKRPAGAERQPLASAVRCCLPRKYVLRERGGWVSWAARRERGAAPAELRCARL